MTAKTTAERQEALRQRRAEQGLTEVRGIYAKPEHHAQIKAYAERLARKPAKPREVLPMIENKQEQQT